MIIAKIFTVFMDSKQIPLMVISISRDLFTLVLFCFMLQNFLGLCHCEYPLYFIVFSIKISDFLGKAPYADDL